MRGHMQTQHSHDFTVAIAKRLMKLTRMQCPQGVSQLSLAKVRDSLRKYLQTSTFTNVSSLLPGGCLRSSDLILLMAQDLQLRGYHFEAILKFFRTISGSAYTSDNELPEGITATKVYNWAAMGLDEFSRCGVAYVSLFCSQLPILKQRDYWKQVSYTAIHRYTTRGSHTPSVITVQQTLYVYPTQNSVMFSTLQVYVSDVPIDQHGNVDTEPLYLTPDIVTGELYCSKTQLVEAPYHPAHLNRLEGQPDHYKH